MGFGHRVYMKKMDPRALMMKEALKQLCDVKGDYTLYEMCEAGEKIMEKKKEFIQILIIMHSSILDARYSNSTLHTNLL